MCIMLKSRFEIKAVTWTLQNIKVLQKKPKFRGIKVQNLLELNRIELI